MTAVIQTGPFGVLNTAVRARFLTRFGISVRATGLDNQGLSKTVWGVWKPDGKFIVLSTLEYTLDGNTGGWQGAPDSSGARETLTWEQSPGRFYRYSASNVNIYRKGKIFSKAPEDVRGVSVYTDGDGKRFLIVVIKKSGLVPGQWEFYARNFNKNLTPGIYDGENNPEGWRLIGTHVGPIGDNDLIPRESGNLPGATYSSPFLFDMVGNFGGIGIVVQDNVDSKYYIYRITAQVIGTGIESLSISSNEHVEPPAFFNSEDVTTCTEGTDPGSGTETFTGTNLMDAERSVVAYDGGNIDLVRDINDLLEGSRTVRFDVDGSKWVDFAKSLDNLSRWTLDHPSGTLVIEERTDVESFSGTIGDSILENTMDTFGRTISYARRLVIWMDFQAAVSLYIEFTRDEVYTFIGWATIRDIRYKITTTSQYKLVLQVGVTTTILQQTTPEVTEQIREGQSGSRYRIDTTTISCSSPGETIDTSHEVHFGDIGNLFAYISRRSFNGLIPPALQTQISLVSNRDGMYAGLQEDWDTGDFSYLASFGNDLVGDIVPAHLQELTSELSRLEVY